MTEKVNQLNGFTNAILEGTSVNSLQSYDAVLRANLAPGFG